ncbi:flagellar filament capping protein FliD [Nevskia sp.]|uniref:flagellar filament capping protein FliD n=1 Tax=Nevskia sp. TaxID=1929292 RepID=UPI0025D7E1D2|nr:flagellar filament capping protein FliD [Nevskia sp.]
MAAITSAGIGSGLDVANIVSQLVAAERGPADQRISIATTRANTSISALANFRSAMANLQTASNALLPGSNGAASSLGKLTATPAKLDFFTASAENKAVAGNYSVEVVSLAAANKRASDLYASSSATVGDGDVTIAVAGKSFTVNLTSPANTLADLRDKINAASDNSGVGAAIVSDGGGARLLLTSRATGTANAVSVSSTIFNTTESQPAADAVVKVDGFTTTSSSNAVTTAVDGLTLNLVKAEPGTSTTLTVGLDQKASEAAVATFVNAYNNVVKFIATQTKFDPVAKTAGILLGDSTVLSATQQLRNVIGGSADSAGVYKTLSAIGITTSADGTLISDTTKFNKATSTDFAAVQRLFAGTDGLATRMSALTKTLLADDGQLQAKTDGLNARLKDLGKQQTAVDVRIQAYEARTRAQFTALDTLMSKLSSTSSYLTQQLAKLS